MLYKQHSHWEWGERERGREEEEREEWKKEGGGGERGKERAREGERFCIVHSLFNVLFSCNTQGA